MRVPWEDACQMHSKQYLVAWKWKVKVKSLSLVWLFATPWTLAYQTPQSMEFSRQEYWSGLPFLSPGDFPNPGIEPRAPTLQADALPSEPPGKFKWLLKLFLRCLWETLPHLFIKPLETTYNFLILYHLLSPYHLIFSTWRSEKLKVSLTWQMFLRW